MGVQKTVAYSVSVYVSSIDGQIQGAVLIYRCRLTSIWIPIIKIRRSRDRLIFNMVIPIPGKDGIYIETGPCSQKKEFADALWDHGHSPGPGGNSRECESEVPYICAPFFPSFYLGARFTFHQEKISQVLNINQGYFERKLFLTILVSCPYANLGSYSNNKNTRPYFTGLSLANYPTGSRSWVLILIQIQ